MRAMYRRIDMRFGRCLFSIRTKGIGRPSPGAYRSSWEENIFSTDREMVSGSWASQLTGVVEYPMEVARGGNNES
jgi:hypothetical protein